MSGINILEEKHMISIMLFLDYKEKYTKTELYSAVSSNPRMPIKLDTLESAGLILQEHDSESRAVRIHLTETGRKVKNHLCRIDELMR